MSSVNIDEQHIVLILVETTRTMSSLVRETIPQETDAIEAKFFAAVSEDNGPYAIHPYVPANVHGIMPHNNSVHCSDPCKLSEPLATIQPGIINNWPESNVGAGTSQRIVNGCGCAEISYERESDSDDDDGFEIPSGQAVTDSDDTSYSDDGSNSSIAYVGKIPSSQVLSYSHLFSVFLFTSCSGDPLSGLVSVEHKSYAEAYEAALDRLREVYLYQQTQDLFVLL